MQIPVQPDAMSGVATFHVRHYSGGVTEKWKATCFVALTFFPFELA